MAIHTQNYDILNAFNLLIQSDPFKKEGETIVISNTKMNFGLAQSSEKARKLALTFIGENSSVFNPFYLRKYPNEPFVHILKWKRLGHAFDLKGQLLVVDKEITLEGLSEVYTVPMAIDSLKIFLEEKSKSKVKTLWVMKSLSEMIFADSAIDKEKLDLFKKNINSCNPKTPSIFATGSKWHTTFSFFIGSIFVRSDLKEAANHQSGVEFYQLPKDFSLKENDLKMLANRYEYSDVDLIKTWDLTLIHFEKMTPQSVENGSQKNLEGLIFALMAISQINKEGDLNNVKVLSKACIKSKEWFDLWKVYDRSLILNDFTQDLEDCHANVQHHFTTYNFINILREKILGQGYLIENYKLLPKSDQKMIKVIGDLIIG